MTPEDLRLLAKAKKMTHREIAERIGVNRVTVTLTLSGRRSSPTTRIAIASAIGVDPFGVRWPEP